MTKPQLIADIDFLTNIALEDIGQAAASLVKTAYGKEHHRKLPKDYNDLYRCERVWKYLPEHRKTKEALRAMGEAKNFNVKK